MPNALDPETLRSCASAESRRKARWAWLGRVPYETALSLQERLRDRLIEGRGTDTLLLLEHAPVITLGRHADPGHVLRAGAVPVVRTSRGGSVTFHGPGQIVGYPVFRLHHGVRFHVRRMAEAVVSVLAEHGIAAEWRESHPGVWIGRDKICAVGVHVRRGVAIHGFALNVRVDLGAFASIVPCGLRDFGVTSMAAVLGTIPALEPLAMQLARAFEGHFSVAMERVQAPSSQLQIANWNL